MKRINSEEREVIMNVITQREASRNCDLPADWDPSPTILLVEDEPAVRLVTREALELGGYKILEANGPAAASQIAQDATTRIDLLLTDVVLPGMNGLELSKLLQTLRPELITLYMTGYADNELLRLATSDMTQRHIQKPFTISSLLSRVADALAARWNGPHQVKAPQHPSP